MMPIEQARKFEPKITGEDGTEVLWSPNTAVVDIQACLASVDRETRGLNPNYKLHVGETFQS